MNDIIFKTRIIWQNKIFYIWHLRTWQLGYLLLNTFQGFSRLHKYLLHLNVLFTVFFDFQPKTLKPKTVLYRRSYMNSVLASRQKTWMVFFIGTSDGELIKVCIKWYASHFFSNTGDCVLSCYSMFTLMMQFVLKTTGRFILNTS